ncbi:secoisolariciresinol dehydrogenase-like [Chenopodium quinoa]|uniref:secoisolariciresinol dehydrogenase-like n=1 Tax=Chenopodium quinoa TaxID=63459 RepID=UPI000B778925|nr:secoisolariciresinol dehydrogenase-like [Chenopodium quinoa]
MNNTSSMTPLTAQRLKGKVAIITGGASGLGKATAKLFVQHGAKVVVGDVQDELGLSLCNEIIASTTNDNDHKNIITYIHCNVSDDNDVKNLIDLTISKHGKLDIMFNNAGIYGDTTPSILATTNENFKSVFETNVYGGFLGAKHAARVMIPAKSGVILFTASIASMMALDAPHAYTMSKHAIIGLMKNLCVELGQYDIRVNAISPCAVSTPLATNALGMDKETIDEVIRESYVLKGVKSEPLDVANAALFLASDEAKFVSGANFVVDGGYTVTNPSFTMALIKHSV